MNPKIEALLKVLDIDEDDQYDWLWKRHDTFGFDLKWINFDAPSARKDITIHLADLAFRLRDEALSLSMTKWQRVMDVVFLKVSEEHWREEHQFTRWSAVLFWFSHRAKPIHWILVALITKEISVEELFDAHLPPEEVEMRVLEYAIGQDNGEGSYGMWDGPNPSLKEMLDVEGRDNNSVLVRYNPDGTDEVIYRWLLSKDLNYAWCKVGKLDKDLGNILGPNGDIDK